MKEFIQFANIYIEGNKIYFFPSLCNNIVKKNNMKYPHTCDDYNDKYNIFDLRSKIINNCINNKMYIYVILYDDFKKPIKIKRNLIRKFIVNVYKRKLKKIVKFGNKHFFYKKNKIINNDIKQYESMNYFTSIDINHYQLAAEITSCFSNHNVDGYGFYSFSIELFNDEIFTNIGFDPKIAHIIFTTKKYHSDNLYSISESDESIDSQTIDSQSIDSQSIDTESDETISSIENPINIPSPSAPPMYIEPAISIENINPIILIKPTAPPLDD